MDMDGVLVHEQVPVPGADRFLARLRELEYRASRIVDSVADIVDELGAG